MAHPQTVNVTGVKFKGESLTGAYPLIRIDEAEGIAVIAHPKHGNIRVPRLNTNLPGAVPVTLSYDDLLAEIRARFDTLGRLMDGITSGRTRSLIVSGAPGVGKTFTIDSKLAVAKAAGKVKKVLTVKGVVSPIALYVCMWENRRKGEVIVIDDSDDIFFDPTGANLIKAATDSGKRRIVSYMKEVAMLDANGIPKTFEYEGSIVVATNLDLEKESSQATKTGTHLRAIMNRALYLDLGLHSQQALMARVEDVCRTTPMLKEEDLTQAQIDALVLWMKENQSTVRSLSLRTAMSLAGLIMTEPTTWKLTAKTTLLKAIGR